MSTVTLRAKHFRALGEFDWQPEGLCLLVGANGTGKTTVLDLLTFLRNLFTKGPESAFTAIGGSYIASLGTGLDEHVTIEIQVDEVRWELRMPSGAAGREGQLGESLWRGTTEVMRAALFSDEWTYLTDRFPREASRCCAKVIWDRFEPEWMRPFNQALSGIRSYGSWWINRVREGAAEPLSASFLNASGTNLWSVLQNWKSAQIRYRGQYDWVLGEIRKAFPGVLGSIEFDRQFPYLFRPGSTDPAEGLPAARAAAGMLVGLLQLTAVAGALPGSIIAFDELENQLHPHAIRSVIQAFRRQVEERGLTIVVTSHSPVVLNAFRSDPEQVHVFERDLSPQPVRLTDMRDEGWLSAFMLGDLYDRLEFAAPDLGLVVE